MDKITEVRKDRMTNCSSYWACIKGCVIQLAGKYASGGVLVVEKIKNKIEKARGNSLE